MDLILLSAVAVAVLATLVLVIVLLAGRGSTGSEARELRAEVAAGLDRGNQAIVAQMASIASVQNNQTDAFSRQLTEFDPGGHRRVSDRQSKRIAAAGHPTAHAHCHSHGQVLCG